MEYLCHADSCDKELTICVSFEKLIRLSTIEETRFGNYRSGVILCLDPYVIIKKVSNCNDTRSFSSERNSKLVYDLTSLINGIKIESYLYVCY